MHHLTLQTTFPLSSCIEFGYKLAYEGLSEDKTQINVIEIKEQKGFIDNIKSAFGA